MKADETMNKDIVLFALYELGGATLAIHTEDIAHRVFQYPIGRQRYRWERYDSYPDKERVARELRRLKKWKGTAFVKGHVNIGAKKDRIDGWMLTAAGVERVKSKEMQLAASVKRAMGTHSVYDAEDLRRRIVGSDCYKIYLRNPSLEEAQEHNLTDMLYCLPDAPKEKVQSAFDQLVANAKAVEAADLLDFLGAVRRRFGHVVSG